MYLMYSTVNESFIIIIVVTVILLVPLFFFSFFFSLFLLGQAHKRQKVYV